MKAVTRDGTRQVELISLDDRPTFKVTDPRHTFQPGNVLDWIPVRTIRVTDGTAPGGLRAVLAPVTVRRLADRGVDLTELVITEK